jgi:hypothetical protein
MQLGVSLCNYNRIGLLALNTNEVFVLIEIAGKVVICQDSLMSPLTYRTTSVSWTWDIIIYNPACKVELAEQQTLASVGMLEFLNLKPKVQRSRKRHLP